MSGLDEAKKSLLSPYYKEFKTLGEVAGGDYASTVMICTRLDEIIRMLSENNAGQEREKNREGAD